MKRPVRSTWDIKNLVHVLNTQRIITTQFRNSYTVLFLSYKTGRSVFVNRNQKKIFQKQRNLRSKSEEEDIVSNEVYSCLQESEWESSFLLYFISINDLEMLSLTLNTKRTHLISVFIVLAENSCTNGKNCIVPTQLYVLYIKKM